MKKPLTGFEVCVFIGLGLGRESAIGGPKIDQRLHGLELMRSEHVEGGGGENKVAEAAVELLFEVQVVKRLGKVGPVQVCIDTKHLTEDSLADLNKVLGEARSLSHPVRLPRAGQLGERRCSNTGVVGIGDSRGLSGEDLCVVNLARDPSLHKRNVFLGR